MASQIRLSIIFVKKAIWQDIRYPVCFFNRFSRTFWNFRTFTECPEILGNCGNPVIIPCNGIEKYITIYHQSSLIFQIIYSFLESLATFFYHLRLENPNYQCLPLHTHSSPKYWWNIKQDIQFWIFKIYSEWPKNLKIEFKCKTQSTWHHYTISHQDETQHFSQWNINVWN